jgi:type VI secretion system protein ImpL
MSSFHLSQFKYVLGLTTLMSFYGIASFITWTVAPALGFKDVNQRIVIIAMLLLTMPFALVGSYLVSRRSKKAKNETEKEKEEKDQASSSSADTDNKKEKGKAVSSDQEVSKGAEEVIQFLKGSNLGSNGSGAAYALPWYLVAGGTKSGKSSLVLGSGLNFQTLPSQRRSEQNNIRPTRQVDWRVTSDAVFVDTAGRFQTEEASEEEWASILETIKKHRSNRPLDGFILAVNAERILRSDSRQIDELAKTIRSRLDETTKRLKTKLPVYLVFTHADAIEGFRDSFSTSKKEGENLVWGATIPLEKSENAQALFDSEYEILQDSIMKRRLIRLSAPFSPTRQLRIFNFPLHFASARRKLGAFVTTLFRPSPFSQSPFLRGFYFTAVPVNRDRSGRKPGANAPKTIGQPFFTKKLFRDVVLRDKDLVKTFQEQKQKPPILGWLLTVLGTFITIAILAMAGVSLINNQRMLDDATVKGQVLLNIVKTDAGKSLLSKNPDEARREIEAIEDLRLKLVEMDDFERNGAPFYMRLGLYSGNAIYKERLLNIYYNAIEQRFKQPVLNRVKKELKQFSESTATFNTGGLDESQEKALGDKYDLLKIYLMWSGGSYQSDTGKTFYKEYAEPTAFSQQLKQYWFSESKLAPEHREVADAQLDFYFKQVDREKSYSGDTSEFPRIELDNTLVKTTREKLKAYPNFLRYLKRVTNEINKKVEPIRIETVLAGRSQGVLEGDYTIPGAYTLEGYRNHMKEAIAKANEELSKDDWVMGEKAGNSQTQAAELGKLQQKYFNEYTDHWRAFVRSTKVIEYGKNKENMSKSLTAFSAEESPMKAFLEEVARNTDLSAEPESGGIIEWITSFWSKKKADKTDGNTPVEKAFRPLFAFVGQDKKDAGDKSSPISQYGASMKRLSNSLGNITDSQIQVATKQLAEEKGQLPALLKSVENSINTSTEGFKATSAGQELANLLKDPVLQVRAFFGAGIKEQIDKIWSNQILSKAKEIENGYPFNNEGEADLTKVSSFLNPINGELSKFYTENLERYFEEKDGKFIVKESSSVKFSPQFVEYLNNAFALRKALFDGKATPNFTYGYQLFPVKNAIVKITIDGQSINSEGTASITLKFPASTGVDTGVAIDTSATGASSTSGDPLPANNPEPPVSTSPQLNNFQQDATNAQLKFPGNWGIFRFFDAGSPQKQPDGKYVLTHKVGGKTLRSEIKPLGGDLFDKSIFRKLKAPDNLQE